MITIDASGKSLGRVASRAASLLMGKNSVKFRRNVRADVKVKIVNASKLSLSAKKTASKIYTRYSGYPGGLREEILSHLIARRGIAEALERAVGGMLPKNKLRAETMKRLVVEE